MMYTGLALHTNTHGRVENRSDSVLRRHTVAPHSTQAIIEGCCNKLLVGGKKKRGSGRSPEEFITVAALAPKKDMPTCST